MRELAIIIPVYNEDEIISEVLIDWINVLLPMNIDFKIKVINDGSTDNTLSIIKKNQERFPNIIDVEDKVNTGHGPTILQAYRNNINYKWIFQVDSDNEISAIQFKKLWSEREKNDLIIGNRVDRTSSYIRTIISLTALLIVKFFYGRRIPDVNIPYRLMRIESFQNHFMNIPLNVFAPNIILSGIAMKNSFSIKVVDVYFKERKTGKSFLDENFVKLLRICIKSFLEIVKYAVSNK